MLIVQYYNFGRGVIMVVLDLQFTLCKLQLDYVNHCIYAYMNVHLYDTYMRYMKLKHFIYVFMYASCTETYMLSCMIHVLRLICCHVCSSYLDYM
jgi:hypothetical protein